MTPEHNMIDGTVNPPEKGTTGEGAAGTRDEGAPVTGEGGSSGDIGENGDVGETPPGGERPIARGRDRGGPPQRPGNGESIKDADERREREYQAKERVEDALTDEGTNNILTLFNARSADPEHPLTEDHLSVFINKSSSYDQIKQAADEARIPADELIELLSTIGHGQETIDQINENRDSFFEKPETDVNDVLETEIVGNIKNNIGDMKDTIEKVKSGEMSDKEAEGKLDKLKKWLSTDPDGGLFREEDRYKRVIAKPLVSIMLALLISYILALSVMTRGSTTRIGGGK